MTTLTVHQIQPFLQGCGYRAGLLRGNYELPEVGRPIPLVAFARQPLDARTACVSVVEANGDAKAAVRAVWEVGSPVAFACAQSGLEWWEQRAEAPVLRHRVAVDRLPAFFDDHRRELAPEAVYRAKMWGTPKSAYQLDFVDMGLMPMVEAETGRRVSKVLERSIRSLEEHLGLDEMRDDEAQWLIRAAFWLLAAKILRDKDVPAFRQIDLADPARVFDAVAHHYGAGDGISLSRPGAEAALRYVCENVVEPMSSLGHMTTESLAYVYENALHFARDPEEAKRPQHTGLHRGLRAGQASPMGRADPVA